MSEITRTEKFLRACIDGEPCKLKPLTRMEKLLAELNETLAGGSSEVVILPETEFSSVGEGSQIPITTPLSATPTAGATAKVTYNGKDYDCPIVFINDNGYDGYVMGNIDAIGGSAAGGNPDAPFAISLVPSGLVGGVYGVILSLEDVHSITLSIVQVGAASCGGGGASAMIVNIDSSTMTIDKPFSDVHAAVSTGNPVHFLLKDSSKTAWCYPSECTANEIVAFYIYFSGGILQAGGLKISSDGTVAPMNS